MKKEIYLKLIGGWSTILFQNKVYWKNDCFNRYYGVSLNDAFIIETTGDDRYVTYQYLWNNASIDEALNESVSTSIYISAAYNKNNS